MSVAPPLLVLSASDVDQIDVTTRDVLDAVEGAYHALASGVSANPGKLTVAAEHRGSVSYAMLGRDGGTDTVAFKTSYKFDPGHDRNLKRYHTTLTLYDDTDGSPIALMDCARVGALRTPAVSALMIRTCAPPEAATVLVVGTGTQGRHALPFAVTACPQLRELLLFGTHPDGVAAVVAEMGSQFPDRPVHVVDDLAEAAGRADVVIAAAGPATPARIPSSWLEPGTLTILVGYGVEASTLVDADYVVATSAEQMRTTGGDMAGPDGMLRGVDAELPDVLAGRAAGRRGGGDRVFAYNSGLVLTDIALGLLFAGKAREQGLGHPVELWS